MATINITATRVVIASNTIPEWVLICRDVFVLLLTLYYWRAEVITMIGDSCKLLYNGVMAIGRGVKRIYRIVRAVIDGDTGLFQQLCERFEQAIRDWCRQIQAWHPPARREDEDIEFEEVAVRVDMDIRLPDPARIVGRSRVQHPTEPAALQAFDAARHLYEDVNEV